MEIRSEKPAPQAESAAAESIGRGTLAVRDVSRPGAVFFVQRNAAQPSKLPIKRESERIPYGLIKSGGTAGFFDETLVPRQLADLAGGFGAFFILYFCMYVIRDES